MNKLDPELDQRAQPPLLSVVGPTGVGKSALALSLAASYRGEIVNADSRQVYIGMDIGTSKPSLPDRQQVPHHLFDFVDPGTRFNLQWFLALARTKIWEIHQRGNLPIVVGGTGQYMHALIEGWETPNVPPQPAYRERLYELEERNGAGFLFQWLANTDPVTAKRLSPKNIRRIIRALEIAHFARTPSSTLRKQQPPPYRILVLGINTKSRTELYQLIDTRVDGMLDSGWLGEIKHLLELGHTKTNSALATMGYRELSDYLDGSLTLEEATTLVKFAHHRLARQQLTWFKPSDPQIHWLISGENLVVNASDLVQSHFDLTEFRDY